MSSSLDFSGLNNFHGFIILGGRMNPITCLVFYWNMKMWDVLVWKIFTKAIWNIANSSKNIQKKHQNAPAGTYTKESNIILYVFRKIHIVSSPPFLKQENEI